MDALNKYRLQALCPACDLVVGLPVLRDGERAACPRCGALLYQYRKNGNAHAAAYAVSALLLLGMVYSYYFVRMDVLGLSSSTSFPRLASFLTAQGQYLLVSFFLVFTLFIPLFCLLATILLCLRVPLPRAAVIFLLRWFKRLKPWCMVEIFLAGVLVSFVKLVSYGNISVGAGFAAYCFFVFFFIKTFVLVDPNEFWRAFEPPALPRPAQSGQSGLEQGLKLCRCCTAMLPAEQDKCPRCGEKNPARKKHSIQVTLALLTSSIIIYLPANIFPVMTTVFLGSGEDSTIIAGASYMWTSGSYFVGLVIFIASVMIPSLKIVSLFWLCFTAKRKKAPSGLVCHNTERLYKTVEFVGRWSMIDVFVVIVVSALVQMAAVMSIYPRPGILYFAFVVIVTMFAAGAFDTRLIWDRLKIRAEA